MTLPARETNWARTMASPKGVRPQAWAAPEQPWVQAASSEPEAGAAEIVTGWPLGTVATASLQPAPQTVPPAAIDPMPVEAGSLTRVSRTMGPASATGPSGAVAPCRQWPSMQLRPGGHSVVQRVASL